MDKNTYNKSIKNQIRIGDSILCCSICGEDDSNVIEFHHVDGKNNSDYEIPLCKNCHIKITHEQNRLCPADRSNKASILKKGAVRLISHGALLKVMGEHQIRFGNELIENDKNCH